MLGHHRDGGEDDRAVLAPLEAQRFARVPLSQRNLTALTDDLDLNDLGDLFHHSLHAFMPSCYHAKVRSARIVRGGSLATKRTTSRATGSGS